MSLTSQKFRDIEVENSIKTKMIDVDEAALMNCVTDQLHVLGSTVLAGDLTIDGPLSAKRGMFVNGSSVIINAESSSTSGHSVFNKKKDNTLQFKTLIPGPNVSLRDLDQHIIIDTPNETHFKTDTNMLFLDGTLSLSPQIHVQSMDADQLTMGKNPVIHTIDDTNMGISMISHKKPHHVRLRSIQAGAHIQLLSDNDSIIISASNMTGNTVPVIGSGKLNSFCKWDAIHRIGSIDTIAIHPKTKGLVLGAKELYTPPHGLMIQSGEKPYFVSVTPQGTDIATNLSVDKEPVVIDAVSLGEGVHLFDRKIGSKLLFRSLVSGQNINIQEKDMEIHIAAKVLESGENISICENKVSLQKSICVDEIQCQHIHIQDEPPLTCICSSETTGASLLQEQTHQKAILKTIKAGSNIRIDENPKSLEFHIDLKDISSQFPIIGNGSNETPLSLANGHKNGETMVWGNEQWQTQRIDGIMDGRLGNGPAEIPSLKELYIHGARSVRIGGFGPVFVDTSCFCLDDDFHIYVPLGKILELKGTLEITKKLYVSGQGCIRFHENSIVSSSGSFFFDNVTLDIVKGTVFPENTCVVLRFCTVNLATEAALVSNGKKLELHHVTLCGDECQLAPIQANHMKLYNTTWEGTYKQLIFVSGIVDTMSIQTENTLSIHADPHTRISRLNGNGSIILSPKCNISDTECESITAREHCNIHQINAESISLGPFCQCHQLVAEHIMVDENVSLYSVTSDEIVFQGHHSSIFFGKTHHMDIKAHYMKIMSCVIDTLTVDENVHFLHLQESHIVQPVVFDTLLGSTMTQNQFLDKVDIADLSQSYLMENVWCDVLDIAHVDSSTIGKNRYGKGMQIERMECTSLENNGPMDESIFVSIEQSAIQCTFSYNRINTLYIPTPCQDIHIICNTLHTLNIGQKYGIPGKARGLIIAFNVAENVVFPPEDISCTERLIFVGNQIRNKTGIQATETVRFENTLEGIMAMNIYQGRVSSHHSSPQNGCITFGNHIERNSGDYQLNGFPPQVRGDSINLPRMPVTEGYTAGYAAWPESLDKEHTL